MLQIFVDRGQRTEIVHVSQQGTVGELYTACARLFPARSCLPDLRLRYEGHELGGFQRSLRACGLSSNATVQLAAARLRGGGGDGGTTGAESRSSFLEMYAKKKHDKVNPKEEKLSAATRCRLTGEPLSVRAGEVLLCPLGHLYNKVPVLQALYNKKVDKTPMPEGLGYINSMKDFLVLDLRRSEDGEGGRPVDASNFQPGNEASFCCPITGKALNGLFKFVALKPSGLVVCESAMKVAKGAAVEGLLGSPVAEQEVLAVNPEEEEFNVLLDALIERRAAATAAAEAKKAAKKQKTAGAEEGEGEGRKRKEAEKSLNGSDDYAIELAKKLAKKNKVKVPEGATASVYQSLFTSSSVQDRKETYGARNLSFRH